MEERRHAIRSAYPYALVKQGALLQLDQNLDFGRYTYLFCLIVASGARDGLLHGPDGPDLQQARGLFQECATVASAGFTRGPAYSLGWPRPDATGFLDKLRQVYADFGDGRVHDAFPPGASAQVKDDGIDVVAWQHTQDVKPPMGYFLGQAASGADWPDKSLKGHVDAFHGTWFSLAPAAVPRVGTIMPFCLASPADADPWDHEAQQAIEGRLRRNQLEHGEVLHRHRVARFLAEGLHLHAQGIGPVERVADLREVEKFVVSYRAQLQAVAAGL